jgi:hypothetical protein
MSRQADIFDALYARLSMVEGVVKRSPSIVVFANVAPSDQPHLSFEVDSETHTPEPGRLSRRVLRVNVYVLAHEPGEAGPMPVLFGLVERLENALKAQPEEKPVSGISTTLGGLVVAARISGTIEYDRDTAGSQGGCVVPVEVVYTQ